MPVDVQEFHGALLHEPALWQADNQYPHGFSTLSDTLPTHITQDHIYHVIRASLEIEDARGDTVERFSGYSKMRKGGCGRLGV